MHICDDVDGKSNDPCQWFAVHKKKHMDRKDGVNSIETEIKTCDVTALGCTCDNERK